MTIPPTNDNELLPGRVLSTVEAPLAMPTEPTTELRTRYAMGPFTRADMVEAERRGGIVSARRAPLAVGEPPTVADEAVPGVAVAEDDSTARAVVPAGGVDGGADVLAGAAVSGHLNTSYSSVSGRYSAHPAEAEDSPDDA